MTWLTQKQIVLLREGDVDYLTEEEQVIGAICEAWRLDCKDYLPAVIVSFTVIGRAHIVF
jgi:hypothetical protein